MTTGRAVVTAMRGRLVIPSRGVAGQRQGLAAALPNRSHAIRRTSTVRASSPPPSDLPPRTIPLFKLESVAMGRPDRANARVQPMSA